MEGFPRDDLRTISYNFTWMSIGGQGTKQRKNIPENFNRLSKVNERYRRQMTDRRTDDDI